MLLITGILLSGCSHKKKRSLTVGEPVESRDFIDFFQPIPLPAFYTDTIFLKKEKDSLSIDYTIFTQFVPDSILHKVFGKAVTPKLYAIGRVDAKAETYLRLIPIFPRAVAP